MLKHLPLCSSCIFETSTRPALVTDAVDAKIGTVVGSYVASYFTNIVRNIFLNECLLNVNKN